MNTDRPLAIAMWDFSWLERRWPGAGYEDWDRVLDELVDRGYDAVRIDPYPHLIDADPSERHTLAPVWAFHDWGSPTTIAVDRVAASFIDFMGKCRDRHISVALSSWYRRDVEGRYTHIATPQAHARQWAGVLELLETHSLLDSICMVDLCNEWPMPRWAPYFQGERTFLSDESCDWMRTACEALQQRFPQLPYTFSMPHLPEDVLGHPADVGFLDIFEPHLWMADAEGKRFCRHIHGTLTPSEGGYDGLARLGEATYAHDPAYWQSLLINTIETATAWSIQQDRPLATTEAWAVVGYKDWPMLDWGWIKDLCEVGTRAAAAAGRWSMICTSNFCGPQFVGMWRDIAWHRRLTDAIKSADAPPPAPRLTPTPTPTADAVLA